MWSLGRGLGEPIRKAGHPVRYLLASGYDWMCRDSNLPIGLIPVRNSPNPLMSLLSFLVNGGIKTVREVFSENPPSTLLFVNLNPFVDRIVIRIARQVRPDVRIVCLYHEPHTENKLIYGPKRAVLLTAYEALSRGMANRSDAIILPSEHAGQTFERYFPRFRGQHRVIPLPYVDEACEENLERRYISFVGHLGNARQKGLDLFLEMAEKDENKSTEPAFQLITGDAPGPKLKDLSQSALKNLRVVHREKLTDQEINRGIRESVAVVLLQRRVMQSGVLPMAFMNGTPVIVSDLEGFTQFVDDEVTGCILPVEPTLEQRFAAVERIRERVNEMSPRCRRTYEEQFDSRCVSEHVPFILGLVEST